jgi:hypothetical protein
VRAGASLLLHHSVYIRLFHHKGSSATEGDDGRIVRRLEVDHDSVVSRAYPMRFVGATPERFSLIFDAVAFLNAHLASFALPQDEGPVARRMGLGAGCIPP